jgi:hypothetical protein
MIADLESVVCEPDAELGCGMRVFYRAVTTAADGTNERDSLAPGLSTFGPIGPPYFVLTPDGQSDL